MQHERLPWIIYEAHLFLEIYPTRHLKESLQVILHTNVWNVSVEKISTAQKLLMLFGCFLICVWQRKWYQVDFTSGHISDLIDSCPVV